MTMQKNEENWRRQQKYCLDKTESHRMRRDSVLKMSDSADPNPAPGLASETRIGKSNNVM